MSRQVFKNKKGFKTRREVALLCFEEKSAVNAVNSLRRWIMTDVELQKSLERAHYRPRSRFFTPQQISVLRHFLF